MSTQYTTLSNIYSLLNMTYVIRSEEQKVQSILPHFLIVMEYLWNTQQWERNA